MANAEYARSNWLRQFEKEHGFSFSSVERALMVNDIDLVYEACLAGMGIARCRPILPIDSCKMASWCSSLPTLKSLYAPLRWYSHKIVISPTKAEPLSTLLAITTSTEPLSFDGLLLGCAAFIKYARHAHHFALIVIKKTMPVLAFTIRRSSLWFPLYK